MGWHTVNEFVDEKVSTGELPADHRLLGHAITNGDGHFAKEIPSKPSLAFTWSPSIENAVLLPQYEHATLIAKAMRGRFRPAVITGNVEGTDRQHFYLPSDVGDTLQRPKAWKSLYQPEVDKYIRWTCPYQTGHRHPVKLMSQPVA